MGTTPTTAPSDFVALESRIQQDIFKVLLYFDIFQHPVTSEEIHTYLPSHHSSPSLIDGECRSYPMNALIGEQNGFYFLKSRGESCVSIRRLKERRAKRRLKIARAVASLIRYFPFVRGIFISGELSKGVASPDGDIDYVIVTSERRLWICRTLLILFKKIVLLDSRKFFCLNHFVSEHHLEVQHRNRYTAMELITLKPLENPQLLERYQSENLWITNYFPNWIHRTNDASLAKRNCPWLQCVIELPFHGAIGDILERLLLSLWRTIWKRRHPELSDRERDRRYECTPTLSTAYGGNFLELILTEYEFRLQSYGLLENAVPLRQSA
jgi:hypothetical protein